MHCENRESHGLLPSKLLTLSWPLLPPLKHTGGEWDDSNTAPRGCREEPWGDVPAALENALKRPAGTTGGITNRGKAKRVQSSRGKASASPSTTGLIKQQTVGAEMKTGPSGVGPPPRVQIPPRAQIPALIRRDHALGGQVA